MSEDIAKRYQADNEEKGGGMTRAEIRVWIDGKIEMLVGILDRTKLAREQEDQLYAILVELKAIRAAVEPKTTSISYGTYGTPPYGPGTMGSVS